MTTTPADIPEGLELRKDGTIVIHIDDESGRSKRLNLNRPKMKELRRLRETEWEIAAEIQAFIVPHQEKLEALCDEHGIDLADPTTMATISISVLTEIRAIRRALDQEGTVFAESLRGPWAAEVIDVLGGGAVEEDDLPPWCFGAAFAAHLLGHWLTVPTRRGSP